MNALVIGSYGLGNVGDNACRDILVDWLRQRNMNVKCSHSPVDDSLIEWADLVVLGGGGLLYDSGEVISLRQSNAGICNKLLRSLFLVPAVQGLIQHRLARNILRRLPLITTNAAAIVDNYMSPIEVAHMSGKATAGVALGTQGIYTDYGRERYAEVLSKLDLLTVRDPADKKVLESIGVHPTEGIKVCEDLGWLVKLPNDTPAKYDIGWVLRWLATPDEEYYQPIINTIVRLRKHGLTQCAQSFSRTDTCFLKHLAKKTGIPFVEYLDKDKAINGLTNYRLVVTNRFHAALFSLLLRKPAIVASTQYSSKSKRLLERLNLPYEPLTDVSELEDKILKVWNKKGSIRINRTDLVFRALDNLALLDKLIRRADVKRPN